MAAPAAPALKTTAVSGVVEAPKREGERPLKKSLKDALTPATRALAVQRAMAPPPKLSSTAPADARKLAWAMATAVLIASLIATLVLRSTTTHVVSTEGQVLVFLAWACSLAAHHVAIEPMALIVVACVQIFRARAGAVQK